MRMSYKMTGMKKTTRGGKKEATPASLLADKRWAKMNAAQRRAYALKMVAAKAAKRLAKAKAQNKAPNGPKEGK